MSEAAGGCKRKRARPAASDGGADGKTTAKEAPASAVEEAEEYYWGAKRVILIEVI